MSAIAHALLGNFFFSTTNAMFQSIERSTAQRWSSHDRVGRRAAHQYLGQGDDDITMPGYIVPLYCGAAAPYSLDTLRAMADRGEAYQLIKVSLNGLLGDMRGKWIILDVTETQSEFFGALPQRIDFSLKLRRVDENRSNIAQVLNAIL